METHCYAGRSRHVSEFYLLAPLNEEKRFIAIVERTAAPEQKYLLNPPGFNYGHLPALNKLKEDQANIIFGNSIGKNNRYKLIAKDKETFVLDLFFEKGELKKYRIAQVDLKTLDQLSDENLTSWQLVQK